MYLTSFGYFGTTSDIRAQVSELPMMSGTRFEVEKFNGVNDYEVWWIRMKVCCFSTVWRELSWKERTVGLRPNRQTRRG